MFLPFLKLRVGSLRMAFKSLAPLVPSIHVKLFCYSDLPFIYAILRVILEVVLYCVNFLSMSVLFEFVISTLLTVTPIGMTSSTLLLTLWIPLSPPSCVGILMQSLTAPLIVGDHRLWIQVGTVAKLSCPFSVNAVFWTSGGSSIPRCLVSLGINLMDPSRPELIFSAFLILGHLRCCPVKFIGVPFRTIVL